MSETKFWIFDKVPLPPTVNELYPVNRYGRKYRDSKGWDERMIVWANSRSEVIRKTANELKWELGGKSQRSLKVDMILVLHPNIIWTQDGHFRKWDADNRIKPMFDALSKLTGIDDRAFSVGAVDKAWDKEAEDPHVIIRMRTRRIRSVDEAINEWVNDVQ